jgi:hypothetical protein
MKAFKSPKDVERHAIVTHCPAGSDDIPCLWLRCDGMKRKRFSLMTHLQDRHCHPQVSLGRDQENLTEGEAQYRWSPFIIQDAATRIKITHLMFKMVLT